MAGEGEKNSERTRKTEQLTCRERGGSENVFVFLAFLQARGTDTEPVSIASWAGVISFGVVSQKLPTTRRLL